MLAFRNQPVREHGHRMTAEHLLVPPGEVPDCMTEVWRIQDALWAYCTVDNCWLNSDHPLPLSVRVHLFHHPDHRIRLFNFQQESLEAV
jgi:hypothetical protein